jgi:hypothetical protein
MLSSERSKEMFMTVERFTKVTHQSWGQNILNSFIGAVLGVLLFFGSFVVLWTNEGKTDWSQVARSSIAVDSSAVNPAHDGKFIAATGNLVSTEQLGDAPYLQPGSYLRLERKVEMFAWKEEQHSDTKKELGGGSTTTTTYDYSKVWTSNPQDSSSFEYSQNHVNPPQRIQSAEHTVTSAHLGAYTLNTDQLEMPDGTPIALNDSMISYDSKRPVVDNYLFIGSGTPDNPQLGDMRIQYLAVPNNANVTVFGTQQGSSIVAYLYRGDSSFFRALSGDRATAIAQLHSEHVMLTWILRLVGFLMMWIGMALTLGPITTFLDVLPILGNASGCVIGLATFGAALTLSTVTVIISLIAHSIIALIILLALIVGGVVLWSRRAKGRPVAATA